MHRIPFTAIFVVALSAVAVSAVTLRKPMLYTETPARAHHPLGPVAVSADARPAGASWSALQAPLLLDDARARYGRDVDAIVLTRHTPLPNGSGARSTGYAVAWD
ncbi:MAG TPA: hypothetical protein PKA33_10115 [Amaricoccus sp.]|uniref:hypothetical protein n=1 Tax=Amaricoccus sp. TaxID=1872485 RepID=UPI002D044137|nr:hypothetical protein [Amaricoccus sp.]HMQ94273.1 hypothetical protein [Amaricoccus sp.]HMR52753.1 hypothetical protein [Amaricoccus sp.]HMR61191.1 hypothetical protein [Amaricoccus sp.]HMT99705.1 hypothetical protein [Amaricoccus sp.]